MGYSISQATNLFLLFYPLFLISLPTISSMSNFLLASHENMGFRVPIFHALDSPLSPFYSEEITDYDRVQAFRSSRQTRNFSFSTMSNEVRGYYPLEAYESGYIMSFQIGSPSVLTYLKMDTGSTLSYLQCKPCLHCYSQGVRDTIIPILDPETSFTYSNVSCADPKCKLAPDFSCEGDTCKYFMEYGDGGNTAGYLSTETITIIQGSGRFYQYPGFVFGCGTQNKWIEGQGTRMAPPGIFGLGTHELSFLVQLKIDLFSFCFSHRTALLGPSFVSSSNNYYNNTLRFGMEAIVKGVKTPMQNVPGLGNNYFYFIRVEGVSFYNVRVADQKVDMLIDTGSTFSYLPGNLYDPLVEEMEKKIRRRFRLQTFREDEHKQLCVIVESWSDLEEKFPARITFHISGLDYTLSLKSTWYNFGDIGSHQVFCSSITRHTLKHAILGQHQMMSTNVGFDLIHRQVYFDFMTDDCHYEM